MFGKTQATSFTKYKPPIVMENDTLPAIMMIKALGATKRSKFIDLRHHYLKEVFKNKQVELRHIPSKECRAYLFTKALQRQRFEELRDMVDVADVPGTGTVVLGSARSVAR